MNVLFVCLGNICRSPSAEAVFRRIAPQVVTDSAGTQGWHQGKQPYGPMQDAAKARGIDMSDLRARQFKKGDFDRFDVIIGMDAQNVEDIESLRPQGNTTPVEVFTTYCSSGADHVPDPYYTRDFEGALDLIEECAKGLAQKMSA